MRVIAIANDGRVDAESQAVLSKLENLRVRFPRFVEFGPPPLDLRTSIARCLAEGESGMVSHYDKQCRSAPAAYMAAAGSGAA